MGGRRRREFLTGGCGPTDAEARMLGHVSRVLALWMVNMTSLYSLQNKNWRLRRKVRSKSSYLSFEL